MSTRITREQFLAETNPSDEIILGVRATIFHDPRATLLEQNASFALEQFLEGKREGDRQNLIEKLKATFKASETDHKYSTYPDKRMVGGDMDHEDFKDYLEDCIRKMEPRTEVYAMFIRDICNKALCEIKDGKIFTMDEAKDLQKKVISHFNRMSVTRTGGRY